MAHWAGSTFNGLTFKCPRHNTACMVACMIRTRHMARRVLMRVIRITTTYRSEVWALDSHSIGLVLRKPPLRGARAG
jgi:hypothetical protein